MLYQSIYHTVSYQYYHQYQCYQYKIIAYSYPLYQIMISNNDNINSSLIINIPLSKQYPTINIKNKFNVNKKKKKDIEHILQKTMNIPLMLYYINK